MNKCEVDTCNWYREQNAKIKLNFNEYWVSTLNNIREAWRENIWYYFNFEISLFPFVGRVSLCRPSYPDWVCVEFPSVFWLPLSKFLDRDVHYHAHFIKFFKNIFQHLTRDNNTDKYFSTGIHKTLVWKHLF